MSRWYKVAVRSTRAILPVVIHGLNVAVYLDAPSMAHILVVTMLLLLIGLYVLDCYCHDELWAGTEKGHAIEDARRGDAEIIP